MKQWPPETTTPPELLQEATIIFTNGWERERAEGVVESSKTKQNGSQMVDAGVVRIFTFDGDGQATKKSAWR